MNTIFSDRAEEVIYHDEELSKQLPKKEKPDRVFGLESTPTLLQLTDRLTTSGEYATLRTSPFRERTVPLLFPFLVLEAKSGRAACDWNEIEMQTVFSIRTLLEIQAELQSSSERTSALSPLPLVWFLSCKGESWRVYPCFMDEDRDGPIYVGNQRKDTSPEYYVDNPTNEKPEMFQNMVWRFEIAGAGFATSFDH